MKLFGIFRPAAVRVAQHIGQAEAAKAQQDLWKASDHYRRASTITREPQEREKFVVAAEQCEYLAATMPAARRTNQAPRQTRTEGAQRLGFDS